jgi:hypothetical protein
MPFPYDLLQHILEKHLFSYNEKSESLEDFAAGVVYEYLERINKDGVSIPIPQRYRLEQDLMDEVMELTRKRTYGHYDLAEFRAMLDETEEKAPSQRKQ